MDILLVDMGNQRVKLRWLSSDRDWSTGAAGQDDPDVAIPIRQGGETDQCGFVQRLDEALGGGAVPSRVLLSAVSQAQAVAAFEDWCRRLWQVEVESNGTAAEFSGLVNDYDDPDQLGCDRWYAALAAHRECQRSGGSASIVVVDAGTAITVDLVHRNHFMGGVIIPGVSTMIQMLGRDTGRIRLKQPDGAGDQWHAAARNSDDAVRSGAFFAACGGVDRCIEAQAQITGGSPRILFTGGDAALVRDGSKYEGQIRANLVLDGLAIVAGEAVG